MNASKCCFSSYFIRDKIHLLIKRAAINREYKLLLVLKIKKQQKEILAELSVFTKWRIFCFNTFITYAVNPSDISSGKIFKLQLQNGYFIEIDKQVNNSVYFNMITV